MALTRAAPRAHVVSTASRLPRVWERDHLPTQPAAVLRIGTPTRPPRPGATRSVDVP